MTEHFTVLKRGKILNVIREHEIKVIVQTNNRSAYAIGNGFLWQMLWLYFSNQVAHRQVKSSELIKLVLTNSRDLP